jgi:hypothetical protein
MFGGKQETHPTSAQTDGQPRSLSIGNAGLHTTADVRRFVSALMGDVVAGRLSPNVTNAACSACSKLLKVVELEYKYGTSPERPRGVLTIADKEAAA